MNTQQFRPINLFYFWYDLGPVEIVGVKTKAENIKDVEFYGETIDDRFEIMHNKNRISKPRLVLKLEDIKYQLGENGTSNSNRKWLEYILTEYYTAYA